MLIAPYLFPLAPIPLAGQSRARLVGRHSPSQYTIYNGGESRLWGLIALLIELLSLPLLLTPTRELIRAG